MRVHVAWSEWKNWCQSLTPQTSPQGEECEDCARMLVVVSGELVEDLARSLVVLCLPGRERARMLAVLNQV
eukprot:SAG31_NODE_1439_length_8332_cov_11.389166_2_plen_71_part_00